MKQYLFGLLVVVALATPASSETLLWDTGEPEQLTIVATGALGYVSYVSGPNGTTPQRWAAIPFRITMTNCVITRLDADFSFTGVPTTLEWIIWNRTGLTQPTVLYASGSMPIGPAGTDDPRVPGLEDWFHTYDGLSIPIAVGDYYLTIYGRDDVSTLGVFIGWFTGGNLQDEALERDGMWRSSTYPTPGFAEYDLPTYTAADPDDRYNPSFALYGIQDVSGACCHYTGSVGSCLDQLTSVCGATGGTFHVGFTCATLDFCPPEKINDTSPSQAVMDVELYGVGTYSIAMQSACQESTVIERDGPPYPYPPNPGWNSIDTEMKVLDLAGSIPSGPVLLSLNDALASTGKVENITTLPSHLNIESGDSFFDVFVSVSLPELGLLVNHDPIHVAASIHENGSGLGALPPDEHFIFQATGGAGTTGDVNGDAAANGSDVQCFVSCAVGSPLPGCNCDCADMNRLDGVTMADIPLFVAVLLGTGTPVACGGGGGIELFPAAGGDAVGKITRVEHWLGPVNEIYGQPVDGSTGLTSDIDGGIILKDFFPAVGVVSDIHWSGINRYHNGTAWVACTENPMGFEIIFYEDVWNGTSHAPGNVKCGPYAVTALGIPDGMFIDSPILYYSVDLDPPCDIGYSWVSIQGVSAPDTCWFLWLDATSSSPLDVSTWRDDAPISPPEQVTLCLTGTPEDFTGGCCVPDGTSYTCQTPKTWSECYALHGVFKGPGSDCSGSNPCDGACCYDVPIPGHPTWITRSCTVTTPVGCSETVYPNLNPVFQGPGTDCDPSPCPQPIGACCLPETGETCVWCIDTTAADCLVQGGNNWTPDSCSVASTCQGSGTPLPGRCGACCAGGCNVVGSGEACDPGIFYRDVRCTPNPCSSSVGVNDCFSAVAKVLVVDQTLNIFGDSTYATNDCPDLVDIEMWHAFTITDLCADVTIKLCGSVPEHSGVETVLYTDCPCLAANRIDSTEYDWSSCGTEGNPTVIWRDLAPGTYYYPVYGGFHAPYVGTIAATACLP